MFRLSAHWHAVLQALFVTFLWSTSWVLIKFGLDEIPPITFAGLRYGLALVCLLPFSVRNGRLQRLRRLRPRAWGLLLLLGLLFYAVTQGAQFVGLAFLPAITVNLLLSFTTIIVALLGILFLEERPARRQWPGLFLALGGALLYFYPSALRMGPVVGFVAAVVGLSANAVSSVLGRYVNRGMDIDPLLVTLVSMGVGSMALLVTGVATEPFPALSLRGWAIILWLAVVNTAFAFTLWNHTLRTLAAVESSIVNSTMMIQIPLLVLLFLGERLSWQEGAGLLLAGAGLLVVQLQRRRHQPSARASSHVTNSSRPL